MTLFTHSGYLLCLIQNFDTLEPKGRVFGRSNASLNYYPLPRQALSIHLKPILSTVFFICYLQDADPSSLTLNYLEKEPSVSKKWKNSEGIGCQTIIYHFPVNWLSDIANLYILFLQFQVYSLMNWLNFVCKVCYLWHFCTDQSMKWREFYYNSFVSICFHLLIEQDW